MKNIVIFAIHPPEESRAIAVKAVLVPNIICTRVAIGRVSHSHCSRVTLIPIMEKSLDR